MAHRTKATPEEKVMLVKKYLAGEISAAEACKIVRINDDSFRSWIRIFKQEGSLGLRNDGSNRKYSSELKSNAVEAYLSGEGSLSEICKRYKIYNNPEEVRDYTFILQYIMFIIR